MPRYRALIGRSFGDRWSIWCDLDARPRSWRVTERLDLIAPERGRDQIAGVTIGSRRRGQALSAQSPGFQTTASDVVTSAS
jgi:hypothetical protein